MSYRGETLRKVKSLTTCCDQNTWQPCHESENKMFPIRNKNQFKICFFKGNQWHRWQTCFLLAEPSERGSPARRFLMTNDVLSMPAQQAAIWNDVISIGCHNRVDGLVYCCGRPRCFMNSPIGGWTCWISYSYTAASRGDEFLEIRVLHIHIYSPQSQ